MVAVVVMPWPGRANGLNLESAIDPVFRDFFTTHVTDYTESM